MSHADLTDITCAKNAVLHIIPRNAQNYTNGELINELITHMRYVFDDEDDDDEP